MKIFLVSSLLIILTVFFPLGILFSLLSKKLSQSERSLWSYCKALFLTYLAVFLAIYLPAFFSLKAYWPIVLMTFLLFLLLGLIAWFYQKDWHSYEKLAIILWGALVFLAVLLLSYNFSIFSPFVIADTGMSPIYRKGDRVFCQINRNSKGKYFKGDVVIFKAPNNEGKVVIRKIIGTAGDSVKVVEGQLFLNNQAVQKVQASEVLAPMTLKAGQYFVLAENSENIFDSKILGPITSADIYVKVIRRVNWAS